MELKYKKLYKNILKEYQKFSTCARMKVAALLVDKGRILSVGYNGVPSGQTHCNDIFLKNEGKFYITNGEGWMSPEHMAACEVSEEKWNEEHHKFANEHELHAEQNCIGWSCKNNINITNATMVLSHEPCEACARLIFSCGIKKVYFVANYDRGSKGIEFLKANGIEVEQF